MLPRSNSTGLMCPFNKSSIRQCISCQEAGAREREAGAREREAGAREREAGAREREAGAREREAGAREREAGAREREAGAREREAGAREREARLVKEKPVLVKEKPYSCEREAEREAGAREREAGARKEKLVLVKEKPVLVKEKPVLVKEKPVLVKEKPVLVKEKPVLVKEKPVLVKEKPVLVKEKETDQGSYYEEPVVIGSLTKETKQKSDYEYEEPVVIGSLTKETKQKSDYEYEEPVVVEALILKHNREHVDPDMYNDYEYETPVVVEALIKKRQALHSKDDYHQNSYSKTSNPLVHLTKDLEGEGTDLDKMHEDKNSNNNVAGYARDAILLSKTDIQNLDIPAIEALALEDQDDLEDEQEQSEVEDSNEKNFNTNDDEIDAFNESGDLGSGIDLRSNSDIGRSFLPINKNILSLMSNVQGQERRKFKSCFTPKNEIGNCMPFQLCSISNIASNFEELLRHVCIIDEVFIGICCPEFPVETVRVDWGEFLESDVNTLDDNTTPRECETTVHYKGWRYVAMDGSVLIAKSSDKIFCGGALITEQYVLTAAHCTVRIPRNHILVRLGLPDSKKRPEPDYEVVEIKRHAGYNPRTMQNDLALLKLSRRVRLGNFRRLVCLPEEDSDFGESASLLRWRVSRRDWRCRILASNF
ncbi:chymotrypsin-like protease CTRL-1 [Caerostris extrusa]|uniref:Chymotrypsin-like protease CTRL-1 n=1 Tax=Caerostris extrusa TaxID=172846 RepID=A0AAV4XTY3_CAEEX|nr:chymotrypsin-like protease CTRL-1 [Caerostris extrusa]